MSLSSRCEAACLLIEAARLFGGGRRRSKTAPEDFGTSGMTREGIMSNDELLAIYGSIRKIARA